jgi:hypothetical protein
MRALRAFIDHRRIFLVARQRGIVTIIEHLCENSRPLVALRSGNAAAVKLMYHLLVAWAVTLQLVEKEKLREQLEREYNISIPDVEPAEIDPDLDIMDVDDVSDEEWQAVDGLMISTMAYKAVC